MNNKHHDGNHVADDDGHYNKANDCADDDTDDDNEGDDNKGDHVGDGNDNDGGGDYAEEDEDDDEADDGADDDEDGVETYAADGDGNYDGPLIAMRVGAAMLSIMLSAKSSTKAY